MATMNNPIHLAQIKIICSIQVYNTVMYIVDQ